MNRKGWNCQLAVYIMIEKKVCFGKSDMALIFLIAQQPCSVSSLCVKFIHDNYIAKHTFYISTSVCAQIHP